MISFRPAGQLMVLCGKNFKVVIFSDIINVIIVKVCMMALLIHITFSDLGYISRSQQCQTV